MLQCSCFRLSSVVLRFSLRIVFILFPVVLFYIRLSSSVVESSLSDLCSIHCFCCICRLFPGAFCCHFLLFLICIHLFGCLQYSSFFFCCPRVLIFYLNSFCSMYLSSIFDCLLLLLILDSPIQSAFAVFVAFLIFLWVSYAVNSSSFQILFNLFHVVVVYLRLPPLVASRFCG